MSASMNRGLRSILVDPLLPSLVVSSCWRPLWWPLVACRCAVWSVITALCPSSACGVGHSGFLTVWSVSVPLYFLVVCVVLLFPDVWLSIPDGVAHIGCVSFPGGGE